MEEKKRIAKGIKLNASQLPLTNKGDFVIGKDSRKVLDNKIIENLNGANHGYFPSTVNSEYRTWSVSRELEIPTIPADAEAQMRMIEGESAAESLQNDPQNPFAHELNHAGEHQFFEGGTATASADLAGEAGTTSSHPNPAYDSSAVARLAETQREVLPHKPASESGWPASLADTQREFIERKSAAPPPQAQFDDAPSAWGAPTADTQTRYVVTGGSTGRSQQTAEESPWAGPEMLPEVSPEPVQNQTNEDVSSDSNPNPEPAVSEPARVPGQDVNTTPVDAQDELLPAWMNALVFDATVSSELQASETPSESAVQSEEAVELETFLNSIPDEEFAIDNETMRHLFSSLCEPKSSSMKLKSAASEAADLAIAAAAAEILKTEVSIDEISIQDLASQEMLDGQTGSSIEDGEAGTAAEFEAIQKAYEMLDLTPLPSSMRKDSAKTVYDAVKEAADELAQNPDPEGASSITRTERGTIEMAIHAGGRQLVPTYNFCGMLTSVAMSDGLSFVLSEEKNTWHMIEQSGKVMVSGIQSVSFDKLGNLSYVTKRGDVVTLKIDGTIDTKFAKKGQVPPPVASAEQTTKKPETEISEANVSDAKTPDAEGSETTVSELKKPDPENSETNAAEPQKSMAKDSEKAGAKAKKSDTKPERKSKSKPDVKVQSKSDTKSEAKTQSKSEAGSDVKAQSKSDDKPQSKTSKSVTKGSAKPKKKGR